MRLNVEHDDARRMVILQDGDQTRHETLGCLSALGLCVSLCTASEALGALQCPCPYSTPTRSRACSAC